MAAAPVGGGRPPAAGPIRRGHRSRVESICGINKWHDVEPGAGVGPHVAGAAVTGESYLGRRIGVASAEHLIGECPVSEHLIGECPVSGHPVGECPVSECPVGECPVAAGRTDLVGRGLADN